MPTPNPLTCDRPPSAEDYAADLPATLAAYRAHRMRVPSYTTAFAALCARRALYAEGLLRQMGSCTSHRSVQLLLKQSLLPEFRQDATIAQGASQGVEQGGRERETAQPGLPT
jgi:hypothetical protein